MKVETELDGTVKILVLGDSGTGKTNIIYKMVNDQFSENSISTTGIDCKVMELILPNENKKIRLQLWDTAGQERFAHLCRNLYSNVDGIMIVYSLVDLKSFLSVSRWIDNIHERIETIPMMLIGNKSDLKNEKIIQYEEGNELAKKYNIKFYEISAKDGTNLNKSIIDFAEEIFRNNNSAERTKSFVIDRKNKKPEKKEENGCCA